MSTTTTLNAFVKPATADRNWGVALNSTLDQIDTAIVARTGSTFLDASAVVVLHCGSTHGVQLAGASTEWLGFWGATPSAQPAGAAQAALTDNTAGDVTAFTLDTISIPAALTDSTGGTASATLAAATNTAALTNSTGGTASTTLAAISDAPTANAVASLAAQLATQRALNTVLINNDASLAAKVNALVASVTKNRDNLSRVARLQTALRAALVAVGLVKGAA